MRHRKRLCARHRHRYRSLRTSGCKNGHRLGGQSDANRARRRVEHRRHASNVASLARARSSVEPRDRSAASSEECADARRSSKHRRCRLKWHVDQIPRRAFFGDCAVRVSSRRRRDREKQVRHARRVWRARLIFERYRLYGAGRPGSGKRANAKDLLFPRVE